MDDWGLVYFVCALYGVVSDESAGFDVPYFEASTTTVPSTVKILPGDDDMYKETHLSITHVKFVNESNIKSERAENNTLAQKTDIARAAYYDDDDDDDSDDDYDDNYSVRGCDSSSSSSTKSCVQACKRVYHFACRDYNCKKLKRAFKKACKKECVNEFNDHEDDDKDYFPWMQ